MTKRFDQAIAKVVLFADEEQDAIALQVVAMADTCIAVVELDDETRAALREGLDKPHVVNLLPTKQTVLWKRHVP